jgi:hypothetical protein
VNPTIAQETPEPRLRVLPSSANDTFFWPSIATVVLIFVGSWIADQMGDAVVLLAAIWVPLLAYLMFWVPPHVSTRVLLLLALILESPDERPGNGYWVPPFAPASLIFYAGMKKWTPFEAISFPLYVVLCVVVFLRARKAKPRGYVPPPPEALKALQVFSITLVAMEVWGMLHGGQGQPSYWQMIQLVTMPLCALAFLYGVRGPRDFRALGTILVVAAVTKGILVMWVYLVVCAPMGKTPFYATTHSDSATFAIGVVLLAANLFEHRDRKTFWPFALLTPLLLTAISMNNRRLAFVGVGFGVVTTIALMRPSAFKKKLKRMLLLLSPVFVAYVKIGGTSTNPFFAPAASINSVMSGEDSSAITRDIENYNLIVTLKENKIIGPGFGFEYIEAVMADDISEGFSLYKFIAHNSVLWLWSVGGLVGFTLIWMVYAMQAFFASRGYRHAATPVERAAGLTTLAATMSIMAQDWGDMGLHSYTNLTLFGICYAVAAKLFAANEPGERPEAPQTRHAERSS